MPAAMRPFARSRPRLGIMKFASCDGCQLTILDLEDHLIELFARFDLVEFAEASSHRSSGPFDVVLVEGSISTPEQAEEIVDAMAERGLPHAYLLFPEEGHGFRKPENRRRALEAELSFYAQVLGFELADAIEPVELVRPTR